MSSLTEYQMKFLTLDWIKAHSRIDFDIEDELLTLYGASAEDTLLNLIGRSYTEVLEQYGEVPVPLMQCALMLVEASYTVRTPASAMTLYAVPYSFDLLIKPYMKLADE